MTTTPGASSTQPGTQQDASHSLAQTDTSASCCGPGCTLTLKLRDDKALSVPRCALSAASLVLREVLSLPLATPGVLEVPDDDPEAWEIVLRMVRPDAYPVALVTWFNVERLLRLADKYDMAVVRGYCAHFLALNTAGMGLGVPLDSPRNTLRAASLLCLYDGNRPELKPYRASILTAVQDVLSPISGTNAPTLELGQRCPACNFGKLHCSRHCGEAGASHRSSPAFTTVHTSLSALLHDQRYMDLVAGEVQLVVSRVLLAGVAR